MTAQVLCFWIDVSTPQILGKVVDFPYITFKFKCAMWEIMAFLQFKLFTQCLDRPVAFSFVGYSCTTK